MECSRAWQDSNTAGGLCTAEVIANGAGQPVFGPDWGCGTNFSTVRVPFNGGFTTGTDDAICECRKVNRIENCTSTVTEPRACAPVAHAVDVACNNYGQMSVRRCADGYYIYRGA